MERNLWSVLAMKCLSTKRVLLYPKSNLCFTSKTGIYSLLQTVIQILKTWICIKTIQFYLNNLKLKSSTTKLNSRTVFSLQNRHLHPLALSICNVVKIAGHLYLTVQCPNVYGRTLRKWICMCNQKDPSNPWCWTSCMRSNSPLIHWNLFRTRLKWTVVFSASKTTFPAFNSATVWFFHGLAVESCHFPQLTGNEIIAWRCWKSRLHTKRIFTFEIWFQTKISGYPISHLAYWRRLEQEPSGLDEIFPSIFVSTSWSAFWGVW